MAADSRLFDRMNRRMGRLLKRLLRPIVEVSEHESVTLVLMFLYSFLAMTAYNILKPITRSQFIASLGADKIPYMPLLAGVAIGVIMQGYSRGAGVLPPKWVIPIAQGVIAGLLVLFWVLFQTGHWMVAAGFYLFGLIMGILLISQFWTLANEIYDARQAKRLFGFIGGGASLGGIVGSSILTFMAGDDRHQRPAARQRRASGRLRAHRRDRRATRGTAVARGHRLDR